MQHTCTLHVTCMYMYSDSLYMSMHVHVLVCVRSTTDYCTHAMCTCMISLSFWCHQAMGRYLNLNSVHMYMYMYMYV